VITLASGLAARAAHRGVAPLCIGVGQAMAVAAGIVLTAAGRTKLSDQWVESHEGTMGT